MAFSFHWIPARNGQLEQEALNAEMKNRSVLGLSKNFHGDSNGAGWSFCIEYRDENPEPKNPKAARNDKIDYRDVMDAESFKIFSALRNCRKQIAEEERVPAYQVMRNEPPARMAESRCRSETELLSIPGIGEVRGKKYGPRLLEALQKEVENQRNRKVNDETDRKSDTADR